MRIGIFEKTFARPSLEEAIDQVAAHGLDCVQFNLACAGLPSMPDAIDPALCDRIREAHAARHVSIAAVSGTFNMIHPDVQKRADGIRRLRVLASSCRRLGTSLITLSTGTRHPTDLWASHEENGSPGAWRDLRASMEEAAAIAEAAGVTLAFEPEVSNTVDSAVRARRLLDEVRSPRIKVVMDAANLFPAGSLPRMREILEEAFDLLGPDIVLAHAKDLSRDGEAGHEAAGTGVLDYGRYLQHLGEAGYGGPLVLHGLSESQVPASVAFLRRELSSLTAH